MFSLTIQRHYYEISEGKFRIIDVFIPEESGNSRFLKYFVAYNNPLHDQRLFQICKKLSTENLLQYFFRFRSYNSKGLDKNMRICDCEQTQNKIKRSQTAKMKREKLKSKLSYYRTQMLSKVYVHSKNAVIKTAPIQAPEQKKGLLIDTKKESYKTQKTKQKEKILNMKPLINHSLRT